MIQEVGRGDRRCRELLVWMEYIIISRDRAIRKSRMTDGENRVAVQIQTPRGVGVTLRGMVFGCDDDPP